MTKPISTKAHGMVDYGTAAMLLSTPLLLDTEGFGAEKIVPMSLGGMTLIASLCTDYELGAMPLIDMKTHLALDVMNGLLLAASPFLFGFSKKTWLPHVLMGLGEVATALMTETERGDKTGQPARRVGGRTKLEGYQPRSERAGSRYVEGVH